MGIGGISVPQLLIILAIVLLIFGTKRLRSFGGDLGGALKSFRKAMDTDDDKKSAEESAEETTQKAIGADQGDAEFEEQKQGSKHKEQQG